MQCSAWAALRRELTARDRIIERAFCAVHVSRPAIAVPDLDLSGVDGRCHYCDVSVVVACPVDLFTGGRGVGAETAAPFGVSLKHLEDHLEPLLTH